MMAVKIRKQKAKKSVSWKIKFKDYKNCLESKQLESKINLREKRLFWLSKS